MNSLYPIFYAVESMNEEPGGRAMNCQNCKSGNVYLIFTGIPSEEIQTSRNVILRRIQEACKQGCSYLKGDI